MKLGLGKGPRDLSVDFILCDISRQGQKAQGLSSAPFSFFTPSLAGAPDPLSEPSTEEKMVKIHLCLDIEDRTWPFCLGMRKSWRNECTSVIKTSRRLPKELRHLCPSPSHSCLFLGETGASPFEVRRELMPTSVGLAFLY